MSALNITKPEQKNIFASLDIKFGPVSDDNIALSLYGVAVKRKDGSYVAFDQTANTLSDVTGLTFDAKGMVFQMPSKTLEVGDAVLYNGHIFFVTEKSTETGFKGISATGDQVVEIRPKTNLLNLRFYTRIKPLIDFHTITTFGDTTTGGDDQLLKLALLSGMAGSQGGGAGGFAGMLPLLLLGKGGLGGAGGEIDPMLLMLMSQQGGAGGDMNPLLLMALLKK